MKKKLLYSALIILMITSMLFISSCGDTSNLSGSVSNVTQDTQEDTEKNSSEQTEKNTDNNNADADDKLTGIAAEVNSSEEPHDEEVISVVLNTNKDRRRIHIPGTYCAGQIHEENYLEWTGTADELKEFATKYGYVACGSCHPENELGIDLPTK